MSQACVPTLDDRLLRLPEAAAVLGLSVRAVRRLAQRGVLTRVRIGGASRVRQSEVAALVRRGTVPVTRETRP